MKLIKDFNQNSRWSMFKDDPKDFYQLLEDSAMRVTKLVE
jgi:hypothetical protein